MPQTFVITFQPQKTVIPSFWFLRLWLILLSLYRCLSLILLDSKCQIISFLRFSNMLNRVPRSWFFFIENQFIQIQSNCILREGMMRRAVSLMHFLTVYFFHLLTLIMAGLVLQERGLAEHWGRLEGIIMMSLLHKTHLKDLFIGDFYGLGVDMKSMQAFAVTVRDVVFDSWKVVGDYECEV